MHRFKIANTVKAENLLSDESVNRLLLGSTCGIGKKCSKCPHDQECSEAFGTPKKSRDIIREFRARYWEIKDKKGMISERRKRLIEDIESMKVVNNITSKIDIQFKIDGIFVCKMLFWVKFTVIAHLFSMKSNLYLYYARMHVV